MRSELMSLICNYLELHQYQKTRSHPPILSDSLEHYGDETQYIVEAIADTIYAFRGSSECPVRGKQTRSIYLSVFSYPFNNLNPTHPSASSETP